MNVSQDSYWKSAYESGEFKHWESGYPSPELVALVAADMIRKNTRVLDVGCGGGIDAVFMAQLGFKVIGVDISATALKIAEKRAEQVHVKVDWRRGSVLELPIDDGSVDFVTDRGLFHLIEDADRSIYSSELLRVLKNKGRALIRGASAQSAPDRFNAVTEEAIDKYFSVSKFKRGPVLPIALFSVEGALDAKIVMLQKQGSKA
jgi:ubiquinone/menaquinone biosynthesis C-methylase UbiE